MGRWSEPEQSLQEERDRGTERSKGCFPDLFWVCACTSARTCWFPSAVFGTVAVFSALKREWEPQSWASQDGKTWTVKFFPLKLTAQLFFFFFLVYFSPCKHLLAASVVHYVGLESWSCCSPGGSHGQWFPTNLQLQLLLMSVFLQHCQFNHPWDSQPKFSPYPKQLGSCSSHGLVTAVLRDCSAGAGMWW